MKLFKSADPRTNTKKKLFVGLLIPILFITVIVSLTIGPMNIGFIDALDIFISHLIGIPSGHSDTYDAVVWDIRTPRVIAAAIVGSVLAVSGCAYQGIFKNPLVEPYILGVSSGAAFGAALCIVAGFTIISFQFTAIAFAFLATALTYYIATVRGTTRLLNLILTGLIVGSLFTAGLSYLKIIALPGQLQEITFWMMGGIYMVNWNNFAPLAICPIFLIGLYLLSPRLNVLALGDEIAESSGINVKVTKILVISFATIITGMAVSMVGVIAWVGLLIPHICRMVIGPDHRYLIPASIFFGAIFMVICDTAARSLFQWEMPISILTSAVMAPILIFIIRKNDATYFGG